MKIRSLFVVAAIILLGGCARIPAGQTDGVRISQADGKLRVEINGKLFTEYHYQDTPRPYFYPLLGPGELPMTRRWPMENTADEEHDHPHHRSLWYAHSSVNGLDFWTEGKEGRIVHQEFTAIESGKKSGTIQSRDNWVGPDGSVVCTDVRTMRIYARPDNERLFDFEITLNAPSDKPVIFGDDKDGAMAMRIAESMRLKHKDKTPGDGHIVLSSGARDEKAWGKRADWCDYYGPVDGKIVGVAIFDHPQNPRHPTWWHVRDYGLFAANPFGIHDFEKKPKGTGDFTLPAGQSVTFRYRFYLHEGDEQQARVVEHYEEYSRTR